ncbi:MazG nucleotide pyrophosphohydrolase domain-containing protein [Arthrobacter sp. Br18]|uniref:MazG nucleotide pyrophosphohydrolase domain-containing protein n=1 Tax=Arthrobacter sp. Br18 TaxID=1312954 RepID=UPI0004AFAF9E|nr:MazG nucleotide pyrophosphohydrolase domain-containing protein [Arthrobacter sp. Br18]
MKRPDVQPDVRPDVQPDVRPDVQPGVQRAARPEPAPVTGAEAGAALERLLTVIGQLRRHCPWTAALTPTSLQQYLVEECYELLDAVEQAERVEEEEQQAGSAARKGAVLDELRGELGDVLYQVVLHAELQRERGAFGAGAVVEGLTAKLVRRNPHVFHADGSLQEHFPATVGEIVATWQAVKATEKPDRKRFDGIPAHLPALALAAETLSRAAAAEAGPAIPPIPVTLPIPPIPPVQPDSGTAEEFGDRLLALAAATVARGVDPELALRSAVHRFQVRAGAASGARSPEGPRKQPLP